MYKKVTLSDPPKPGARVRYIPGVAMGDPTHPDCEDGRVSSVGSVNVFVKFDNKVARHGWDGATAESCTPSDLVLL